MLESAMIGAAAGFAAGRAGHFLDELLKPTAALIGTDIAERYREWRGQNLADVLIQANDFAQTAGLSVGPVPGRILFPILEYASMEDDASLRRLWASLLANAASQSSLGKTLPAFAEILRQLTPVEATLLQYLHFRRIRLRVGDHWHPATELEVRRRFLLEGDDYFVAMGDLDRLQLVEGRRRATAQTASFKDIAELAADRWHWSVRYKHIGLTALGLRFIEHCTAPPPNTNPEFEGPFHQPEDDEDH
jgi:hypothetical protein